MTVTLGNLRPIHIVGIGSSTTSPLYQRGGAFPCAFLARPVPQYPNGKRNIARVIRI